MTRQADSESMKSGDGKSSSKQTWFVHREGTVLGPFSSYEIEARVLDGTLGEGCLIWARGTTEWSPIAEWKDLQTKVEALQKVADGRIWYCDSGSGQPAGPLTQSELIDHLKGLTRLEAVTLWGTGLHKWMPLFEVPDVMDLLGISRRENPRAPLLGSIAITPIGSTIPAQVLPALTISIGGFGVRTAGFLNRGDRVQIAIKSSDLPSTIHATGEVVYVSRSGDAGIKFTELPAESKSILFDHVRRFTDASATKAA